MYFKNLKSLTVGLLGIMTSLGLLLPTVMSRPLQAQTQSKPSLAPILEQSAPFDIEYLKITGSAAEEKPGDFLMMQMALWPDRGLILRDSHKGNDYEFGNNAVKLNEIAAPATTDPQPTWVGSYPQAMIVNDKSGPLKNANSFTYISNWSLTSQPTTAPQQINLFAKSTRFLMLSEFDAATHASSLVFFPAHRLLPGSKKIKGVRLNLNLDENIPEKERRSSSQDEIRLYGIAVERSQNYDVFYRNRQRLPIRQEGAPQYDQPYVYMTAGDRLLIMAYGESQFGAVHSESLMGKIDSTDLTAGGESFPVEIKVKESRFPSGDMCRAGCYGIDITPSPLNSQVNWLWIGNRLGGVEVYSLQDPLHPQYLTSFTTPISAYPYGSDRRVMSIALLRYETPMLRVFLRDAAGKGYVYDSGRQIFRNVGAGVLDEMQFTMGVNPADLGYKFSDLDKDLKDKSYTWRTYKMRFTPQEFSLQNGTSEDEQLPNIWQRAGGYLAGLLSKEYRVQQIKPILTTLLGTLTGNTKADNQYSRLSSQFAPPIAEFRAWREQALHSYELQLYTSLCWAFWLTPHSRWLEAKSLRLFSSPGKAKVARRLFYWLPNLAGVSLHQGIGMIAVPTRLGELRQQLEHIASQQAAFVYDKDLILHPNEKMQEQLKKMQLIGSVVGKYFTARLFELIYADVEGVASITENPAYAALADLSNIAQALAEMKNATVAFFTPITDQMLALQATGTPLPEGSAQLVNLYQKLHEFNPYLLAATDIDSVESLQQTMKDLDNWFSTHPTTFTYDETARQAFETAVATYIAADKEKKAQIDDVVKEMLNSETNLDTQAVVAKITAVEQQIFPVAENDATTDLSATEIAETGAALEEMRLAMAQWVSVTLHELESSQIALARLRRQLSPNASEPDFMAQQRQELMQEIQLAEVQVVALQKKLAAAQEKQADQLGRYRVHLDLKETTHRALAINGALIAVEMATRSFVGWKWKENPFVKKYIAYEGVHSPRTHFSGFFFFPATRVGNTIGSGPFAGFFYRHYTSVSTRALGLTWAVDEVLATIRQNDEIELELTGEEIRALTTDLTIEATRLRLNREALTRINLYAQPK